MRKFVLLFLALISSVWAAPFVLLLPDGSDLWRDKYGNIHDPIDRPTKPVGYVPLDATVPDGFRQIGWKLSGGKCVADVVAIPAPSKEETDAKAAYLAKLAEVQADTTAADQLKKFIAVFEDKSASPELQAEAIRLLLRDYLRRIQPLP